MLPSVAQIKAFIIGVIIPPLAGALASWLIGTHVLDIFGITKAQIAYEVTQLGIFTVVYAGTWLTNHHMLLAANAAKTPNATVYK